MGNKIHTTENEKSMPKTIAVQVQRNKKIASPILAIF
jgi:hypothetical protein